MWEYNRKRQQNLSPKDESCAKKFYDSKYVTFIIEYSGDIIKALEPIDYACAFIIDKNLAALIVENDRIEELVKEVKEIRYVAGAFPYTLNDLSPLDVANITKFHTSPYLKLTGQGVIVGILDTGIDYLNDEFCYEDGTTRILGIWDQSIEETIVDPTVILGSYYSRKEINKALEAKRRGEDPYAIVPSKDLVGHGTKMAGIIGARGKNPEIIGGAPSCEFAVVKLKPSFLTDNGEPVYAQADILLGLKYFQYLTETQNNPIVIYLPVGSNLGSHDGNNLLERYIDRLSEVRATMVVTSTGNEGNQETHTSGRLEKTGDIKTIEIRVSPTQSSIFIEIWGNKPDKIALSIISPSGEVVEKLPAKLLKTEEIKFVYEGSKATITYYLPEEITGDELISIRIKDLKPGIWQFRLIGEYIVNGRYDAYIPQRILLKGDTRFLNSTSETTLTTPSTSRQIITTGFYNQTNNAIVAASGRGYTRDNRIKPDLAAGGVNAKTIAPGGQIVTVTGGSVASAVLASACALLFQWGVVDGNDPYIYAQKMKSYLIGGTSKRKGDIYPNPEWGYGTLNLEGVFDNIRSLSRET